MGQLKDKVQQYLNKRPQYNLKNIDWLEKRMYELQNGEETIRLEKLLVQTAMDEQYRRMGYEKLIGRLKLDEMEPAHKQDLIQRLGQ